MATPLRVLLIEDSENDAALVIHELSHAGYEIASARVDTADALTAALENNHWDLAIADYTMPQFSGTAAMRSRAHDYIIKGQLKRLAPAVERELREVEVRRSRKHTEERLVHLAYHDPHQSAEPASAARPPRAGGARRAADARAARADRARPRWLQGHQRFARSLCGDRVLQQVGTALRGALRETDTVARLGGDEFALMLPRTDGAGAERAVQKALQLHAHVVQTGQTFHRARSPSTILGRATRRSAISGFQWMW